MPGAQPRVAVPPKASGRFVLLRIVLLDDWQIRRDLQVHDQLQLGAELVPFARGHGDAQQSLSAVKCRGIFGRDGDGGSLLRAAEVARMRGMSLETFRVVSQPSARAGQQILQLQGAFTSTASAVFVDAVAGADAPRLILDLTEVPMVDSMAVGALVRAFVSCHKSGRKLALVGLNHRVHNVLHLTGIAPLFDTYATISDAEAGLA